MNAVTALDAPQCDLPTLAERINTATSAAETHAQSAVENAVNVGRLLIEAKGHVPHGEWESWLTANCTVSVRTAQAYMRLSKHLSFTLGNGKAQRVAHLPLREAMTAIGTVPDPAPRPAQVVPEARPPRDFAERKRTVAAFRKAASSIRDAAKWFDYGLPLKPAKAAYLRNKLQTALAELDRLSATEVAP